MALTKNVLLDNGVSVSYHRIVSITNVTNKTILIEVASYTSQSKREEEKEKLNNKEKMNIFIHTEYVTVPYDENYNIKLAYEHIKTSAKYATAEDC